MAKHAVHRLFESRLARCTKPFNARGGSVKRCDQCRIDLRYCMCDLRPNAESNASFLLLFYDDEVLKPSNTGKLIADLIPDTYAFLWQRTEVSAALLTLLSDTRWFPIVVFPSEYVEQSRVVFEDKPLIDEGKRPLFILLDGSWREAKKMYRNSPYLDGFPVLSINPAHISKYIVRKATRDYQLATAEVASFVLDSIDEPHNGNLLRAWFDLFSYRYQQGVQRKNLGDSGAQDRLIALLADQC